MCVRGVYWTLMDESPESQTAPQSTPQERYEEAKLNLERLQYEDLPEPTDAEIAAYQVERDATYTTSAKNMEQYLLTLSEPDDGPISVGIDPIEEADDVITDLSLNWGSLHKTIPVMKEAVRGSRKSDGAVILDSFSHIVPTTPITWAKGVKSRLNYWEGSSASPVVAAPFEIFRGGGGGLAKSEISGESHPEGSTPNVQMFNYSDVASWVLDASHRYYKAKEREGGSHPFLPTEPQEATPLFDRYRYDPAAERMSEANRNFTWSTSIDAFSEINVVTKEIANQLKLYLGSVRPKYVWTTGNSKKDAPPTDDEILSELRDAVQAISMPTTDEHFRAIEHLKTMEAHRRVFMSWDSTNSFLNSMTNGNSLRHVVTAILDNPAMHTNAEMFNRVKAVQTFRNATVVSTAVSGAIRSPGEVIDPNPESMLTPGLAVDWVPTKDPALSESDVQHVASAFAVGEQPDIAIEARVMAHLNSKIPLFNSLMDNSFPNETHAQHHECMLRLMGSCIFGGSHKMIGLFSGISGGGKDTIIGIMERMVVPGAVGNIPTGHLKIGKAGSQVDDLARYSPLENARFAKLTSEVSDQIKLDTASLKSITSGGMQTFDIRGTYEKKRTISFDGALLMTGESFPMLSKDDGGGLEARFVCPRFEFALPGTRFYTGTATAPVLTNDGWIEAYDAEAPYIAVVLFFALQRWNHGGGFIKGLGVPEEWNTFAGDALNEADEYSPIENCFSSEKVSEDSVEITVASTHLSDVLVALTRDMGIYARTSPAWTKRMSKVLGDSPKVMRMEDGSRARGRIIWFTSNDHVSLEVFYSKLVIATNAMGPR